jgi:hypothetical protein
LAKSRSYVKVIFSGFLFSEYFIKEINYTVIVSRVELRGYDRPDMLLECREDCIPAGRPREMENHGEMDLGPCYENVYSTFHAQF